jgi:hypothetical protein
LIDKLEGPFYVSSLAIILFELKPVDRLPVHELSAVNRSSLRFEFNATEGRFLRLKVRRLELLGREVPSRSDANSGRNP